jgi:hypothetical protein
LWQYSCQNYSLGSELRLAGYESLAIEKHSLSEMEKLICNKFSALLLLGQQQLNVETPDFVKIQEILECELQPRESNDFSEQKLINPREEKTFPGSEEQTAKRSRSNPLDGNTIDPVNQYSQTATEGEEWRSHFLLDQTTVQSGIFLTPPSTEQKDEEMFATPQNPSRPHNHPFHPSSATSDHTIIGSLSQEIIDNKSGSDGHPNLSVVSGTSSVIGSVNQSTPSPELLQQRSGLRRYHSNDDRLYFVERSPIIDGTAQCKSDDQSKIERRSLTQ